MTVVVGGSSPQITFADSTVQNTAALPLTGGSVSADITVHGLTVGLGGGSVSTNTAVGTSALAGNSSGNYSVAVGYNTGATNSSGTMTAVGAYALNANTSGTGNAALGINALTSNTTGGANIGIGDNAVRTNTTGSYNVGVGIQSLFSNTTASNNTAVGYQSLYSNTTGGSVSAFGYQAGYSYNNASETYGSVFLGQSSGRNTTGHDNTFVGAGSGYNVTSGSNNVIIGACQGGSGTPINATGSNYVVFSDGSGTVKGYFNNSNYLVLNYVGTTASSPNLYWNGGTGLVSYNTSALKYKTNVRDLPQIDITKFRPVVYNSLCDGDDKTQDHFGFIADEVDSVGYKQIVNYRDGQVDGFQYDRMTVVLTQAVQQLLATVTAQATEIAALKTKVGA